MALSEQLEVGLFVTCIVDSFRPSVSLASIKLLEDKGCNVHIPIAQTCCGQTAWNGGDESDAQEMAITIIKNFETFDYIVMPSDRCAKMVRENYPKLFNRDPTWKERANNFCGKVYELTEFLEDILKTNTTCEDHDNMVVGKDMALLLETASKLNRQTHMDKKGEKSNIKEVRHIAEVLAGMMDTPAIGGR